MSNYYVLKNKENNQYVYMLNPLIFTDLIDIALLIKEKDIYKYKNKKEFEILKFY